MTTSLSTAPAAAGVSTVPGRRVLLGLALGYLLFFVVIVLFLGNDNAPDADPAVLMTDPASSLTIQLTSYVGMVACAVLVFFGAAVRSVLAARTARWTADVALVGFVVWALTLASWAVSSLALWHAVDLGDAGAVRAMNLIDTSNFLPAMLAMICSYGGVGAAALAGRSLPRWLGVTSVVLAGLAPLGPLGFVPFMLFPLWMVAVAWLLRPAPVTT